MSSDGNTDQTLRRLSMAFLSSNNSLAVFSILALCSASISSPLTIDHFLLPTVTGKL